MNSSQIFDALFYLLVTLLLSIIGFSESYVGTAVIINPEYTALYSAKNYREEGACVHTSLRIERRSEAFIVSVASGNIGAVKYCLRKYLGIVESFHYQRLILCKLNIHQLLNELVRPKGQTPLISYWGNSGLLGSFERIRPLANSEYSFNLDSCGAVNIFLGQASIVKMSVLESPYNSVGNWLFSIYYSGRQQWIDHVQ